MTEHDKTGRYRQGYRIKFITDFDIISQIFRIMGNM